MKEMGNECFSSITTTAIVSQKKIC